MGLPAPPPESLIQTTIIKLVTTLSIASTLAANANWFTNLFESAEAQAVREHREKYAICPDPFPCAWHQQLTADFQKACNANRLLSYAELQAKCDRLEAEQSEKGPWDN